MYIKEQHIQGLSILLGKSATPAYGSIPTKWHSRWGETQCTTLCCICDVGVPQKSIVSYIIFVCIVRKLVYSIVRGHAYLVTK